MNKEIKVGALSLGLTYAGCFFGAGFVSGKELYEFFGAFGVKGYLGLALAIILFAVFGSLLIRNVQLSGRRNLDDVLILPDLKLPRIILGAITIFIMYGILVVMAAGAGALINQVFDLPHYIGCLLFIALACFGTLYGISGAVKVFTYLVPVLVVMSLIICFTALSKYGISFDFPENNDNPLLLSWWFSAVTYVSYNIITLIGAMIPVGAYVKKKSTAYIGIISGCLFAMSIALGIFVTVTSVFSSVESELPMLTVAFTVSNIFGFIYAFLLIAAMYGASLSCFVGVVVYCEEKSSLFSKHKKLFVWALGIIAFLCSLVGFGNLVNTVYPLFGYFGFVILALIIANFIYLKVKK